MPKKKSTKSKRTPKRLSAAGAARSIKERRKIVNRRRGVIDAIYQRLVKRDILPDRRKGERRGIEFRKK